MNTQTLEADWCSKTTDHGTLVDSTQVFNQYVCFATMVQSRQNNPISKIRAHTDAQQAPFKTKPTKFQDNSPAPCHPDLSLPAISVSRWPRDQSPHHSIHPTSQGWICDPPERCHGPLGRRPTTSRRSRECRRPFLDQGRWGFPKWGYR